MRNKFSRFGIAIVLVTAASFIVEAQTASDPLASLGSDKYANGELPLGDQRYVTSGPKKGYIYLCRAGGMMGGGAQRNGPWIGPDTWNLRQKISVEGHILWPNAAVSISVRGEERVITLNDLPKGVPTGIFPIQPNDPAYVYDRNPNRIEEQSLSFSLPAHPVAAASPECVGGEVGVMNDGVMLFNGFDAGLRDAPAHEVQDMCSGHPQVAGEYHYHGPSACLPDAATTVIGFAFDGFPITGAKIAEHRYLTTADLDECHGITSSIVLDGATVTMYHYVMTADFPYSVSCFHGSPAVHGPSVRRNGLGGAPGQQDRGGPPGQRRVRQQPPPEAIAACVSAHDGDKCYFYTPSGDTIMGSCRTPPMSQTGQSVCVPSR